MPRYYGTIFFVVLILFLMTFRGWCDVYQENQDVLVKSRIRKSSFKQIFNDIKKILPKELKQCPIILTSISLVKIENNAVTEDWTVNICQETKVFCVQTYWLKGSYLEGVRPKEEVFAKQKAIWETAKKMGNEEEWRGTLFYINEIEAMEREERK